LFVNNSRMGIKQIELCCFQDRVVANGGHNMRTKATINRLNMYKNFKPIRNKSGEIIKAAPFQGWNASGTVARVEPNRKWFGNTRVITQNALQKFQDDMKTIKNDPYKVVMKQSTLPITLLNEKAKVFQIHRSIRKLVATSSTGITKFGPFCSQACIDCLFSLTF
jgi:hypothetical protein